MAVNDYSETHQYTTSRVCGQGLFSSVATALEPFYMPLLRKLTAPEAGESQIGIHGPCRWTQFVSVEGKDPLRYDTRQTFTAAVLLNGYERDCGAREGLNCDSFSHHRRVPTVTLR